MSVRSLSPRIAESSRKNFWPLILVISGAGLIAACEWSLRHPPPEAVASPMERSAGRPLTQGLSVKGRPRGDNQRQFPVNFAPVVFAIRVKLTQCLGVQAILAAVVILALRRRSSPPGFPA
jgi:hypothetical protein